MKDLILIIGAPGSGKTTDASIIAQQNNDIAHFSTGELLREEVASGSDLGKQIDEYISKGNLVPLQIVISTIVSTIRNSNKNLILIDGYPRSIEQMIELDKVLNENKDINLKYVIEVDVCENTAKNRVLGRARGNDDKEEVFYNRMKVYLEPIKSIRDFYKSKSVYKNVNGEGTIEEIVSNIKEIINN